MYHYPSEERALLQRRVDQFRGQVNRFLDGKLDEDEFKQLRLRNGLYMQRHAPMLRVAIPYGVVSSEQLRTLATVSTRWDRGYGHMTTRQNIQFNWIPLKDTPDVLQALADVDMHAIQTSGNCIRNITTDPLAGASADEYEDPRPWCELIRQWANFHPEFNWLPRKFKIAVSGAQHDRAAVEVHDIGLRIRHDNAGNTCFDVFVGGGLGRTPHIGKPIALALPAADLLSYLEAILRVYNRHGRRDNIYKARIKILVNALGIATFQEQVDAEWQHTRQQVPTVDFDRVDELQAQFATDLPERPAVDLDQVRAENSKAFGSWLTHNTRAHKRAGYRTVFVSLKHPSRAAGDISDQQMRLLADLADQHSQGELRATHDQNLVLAHVPETDLPALWQVLAPAMLAYPNIDTLTDMIVCPGLDYCSLANASSIAIWDQINAKFSEMDYLHDLGHITVRVSGCMNACGHHHVADIGVLGVEKKGVEWYQLTLGGRSTAGAKIGQRLGPAIAKADVADTVERILAVFAEQREPEESFNAFVERNG
ncbi:MAG: nitrite/sulfite reductase, partial [Pseudomonadota bacterium]